MNNERREAAFVYRVRLPEPAEPAELISVLTHAAWRTLSEAVREADPHRWISVFRSFQRVLGGRLVRHAGCGGRAECRGPLTSVFARKSLARVEAPCVDYLLESPVDAEGLVRLMARRAAAVFSDEMSWKNPHQMEHLEEQLIAGLERAWSPYLFGGDVCRRCGLRLSPVEKRVLGPGKPPAVSQVLEAWRKDYY